MKSITIFQLFAVVALSSCMATQITFKEDEYVSKIFEDTPGTKDELFLKANRWMVAAFNNAESVIQHSDKVEGVIIGKYLMSGTISSGYMGVVTDTRVYAIVEIRVKDSKAKIDIKPQGSWRYDDSGMSVYDYSKEKAIKDMNTLANSFHQSLLKQEADF